MLQDKDIGRPTSFHLDMANKQAAGINLEILSFIYEQVCAFTKMGHKEGEEFVVHTGGF